MYMSNRFICKQLPTANWSRCWSPVCMFATVIVVLEKYKAIFGIFAPYTFDHVFVVVVFLIRAISVFFFLTLSALLFTLKIINILINIAIYLWYTKTNQTEWASKKAKKCMVGVFLWLYLVLFVPGKMIWIIWIAYSRITNIFFPLFC